jgi:hypothetical protein
MLPSNHFSQDAIDWANTDIPDDMMYRMLQADERFYEYVRNGELRFKEDRSKNMFIAERMHSGIRSLFDVQKDKVPYATINESDYLESMRSMWRYIVKNPREVAAFNPHFLYSEEVEALKAAIWNSPDRSMRQNELQSFAIMAVNQSEDEDLNDFNLIDELLSYKKEYKQRVRTRKQKSTRRFSKALDVCSKALALW